MPKKIKTKQKQQQKQKQTVVVNITNKKRVYAPREKKEPARPSLLPMMPSFNINQPATQSQASDLSKLVGMLIPKLQTQSTLGTSIPVVEKPKDEPVSGAMVGHSPLSGATVSNIPLETNVKENLLGDALNRATQNIPEATSIEFETISGGKPERLEEPIMGKKLRKNSQDDLQQRYYALTGKYMEIPKGYKMKDFRELVERMENV